MSASGVSKQAGGWKHSPRSGTRLWRSHDDGYSDDDHDEGGDNDFRYDPSLRDLFQLHSRHTRGMRSNHTGNRTGSEEGRRRRQTQKDDPRKGAHHERAPEKNTRRRRTPSKRQGKDARRRRDSGYDGGDVGSYDSRRRRASSNDGDASRRRKASSSDRNSVGEGRGDESRRRHTRPSHIKAGASTTRHDRCRSSPHDGLYGHMYLGHSKTYTHWGLFIFILDIDTCIR